MGIFGRHKSPAGHRTGNGYQMSAEHRECKSKLFMAMVFFGLMAVSSMFIVGIIHLMLHAVEVFHE